MTLLRFNSPFVRGKKGLLWLGSAWLIYTIFGFVILPSIVRAVAVKRASQQLGRTVTLQKVRFNPYTLSASLQGVSVQDKDGQPLASWKEAYVNFQLASLFQRAWVFKEVRVSQPLLRVQINPDYTLNFSDLAPLLGEAVPAAAPNRLGKSRGWRIDRVHLTGARVAFDFRPSVPFRRTVGPFDMTLTDFRTDSNHANRYPMSGITDAGEEIAWQGFFSLAPLRSAGEFSLKGLCLTNYAPLYQDAVRLQINEGVVSLSSSYRYERSGTTRVLSITNATIDARSLKVAELQTGRTALAVGQCLVSGASLDAMVRRAEVEKVALTGTQLVLLRNRNLAVNVIEMAKAQEAAPHMPGGIALLLKAMTNVVAMLRNTTNLSTGAIHDFNLSNGTLRLEDLANSPPVRVDFEDIAASARNIANREASNMTAEVRMRCGTNGAIHAGITPSLPPTEAEIKLTIDKVDLLPLAPSSRRYLGYQLKQGALSLDSSVRLAEEKLTSQNRITLDQLVLGEKVENPEATILPVRLAVAILKDRTGKIQLDMPVDGSPADPDFHLGDVISGAIGNVLNRIALSPFSALSSLFGAKAEALSFIEFEPGSTNLLPAALEKLRTLATGLAERPELQLVIEGRADPKTDGEALRGSQAAINDHLPEWSRHATTDANPLARASSNAVMEEKGAAALMRLVTSSQENWLSGQGSNELQRLATERAFAVKEHLLHTGALSRDRISITAAREEKPAPGRNVNFHLQ